ncbi:MAG: threonine/homoserine/homoserine lactone efflux protein [Flavobacteriaceae bacterium]|jgi:threonine/homoserine/homoserine lactone efflux protein
MLEALVSFSFATLVLALSPGPDNIYVITQSLVNGTKAGIATTAGLISGCIVHTALLAFGVSALITASESIFYGIKIFGALYLLYLAYTVYKSDASVTFSDSAPKKSNWKLFKQGVFMNLVNPKVMIFFLAFFPVFLWDTTKNTVFQFFTLGATFMLVSFLLFSSLALLAGSIKQFMIKQKSAGRVMKWLQIIVFVGISIYILTP